MLSQQVVSAAAVVERKIYGLLAETEELTDELARALERQDQVAVRMFLSLRQDQVDQLTEQKALLKQQCRKLPPQEGALLRQFLNGEGTPASPQEEALARQVEKNRTLLERILRADRVISRRLGGAGSFYVNREK